MLWWIAGVLMLSGLAGLVTSYRMEGVISIALVLVVAIALAGLIRERCPRAGRKV
jgi:cytochrome c oxidase subunit IV